MTEQNDIIEARNITFAYPGQDVLRDVTFTASAGRFVCLLGPNGSGKTTLLRILLRQLIPQHGQVSIEGKDINTLSRTELAKSLASVPQFPKSAFSFPVRELVLMGRYAYAGTLGLAGKQDLAVAKLAMEMTDTLKFASRSLEELSGGEAQCVMIARALAQQPKVMLLDEPTSHLDVRNQLKIYRMMQRLAHDWQMGVVCVSHDINLAGRFADQLVLISDGRTAAAGPPQEVITEQTLHKVYSVNFELIPSKESSVPVVMAK